MESGETFAEKLGVDSGGTYRGTLGKRSTEKLLYTEMAGTGCFQRTSSRE